MKKIIATLLLIVSWYEYTSGQINQHGTVLSTDDGSVVILEEDSGTSIIVGGNDSTRYDSLSGQERQEINRSTVYSTESVPNPKVLNNTYVSDPDHYLSGNTITEINRMLFELEKKTTDQVAVVVLHSIGDMVPKTFATKLFNQWGIGIRGKDNGLLILMIIDQRRIEFETGYGMESMLPDAICYRIQQTYMVPEFKIENYDQGILEGVKATVDILSNPENSKIAAELKATMARESQQEREFFVYTFGALYAVVILIVYLVKRKRRTFKDYLHEREPNYLLSIGHIRWLFLYVGIPLLYSLGMLSLYGGDSFIVSYFIGCYGIALLFVLEKRIRLNRALAATIPKNDYYGNYLAYTKSHQKWWIAALLFPFIFVFYLIYIQWKKRTLRHHSRNCKKCQQALTRLGEKEDDSYLLKTQLLEEGLRSIDYDVWLCQQCGYKEILAYVNFFSKYSTCKSCQVKSSYLFSDRTITEATYSSSGTGCKTYKCKNCSYEREETYEIPMKTSSSSSSDSSDSGSFGGGSSGGGGSGSSW